MKNIILIFAVFLLIFQSCKKSTSSSNQQTLIQNRWQVQNISTLEHVQGSEDKVTNYNGTSADYFDFRNDGRVYSSLQGSKDTSNYALVSNNVLSINGSTAAIISVLNSNSFVFSLKTNTSTTNYDQVTYYLKR